MLTYFLGQPIMKLVKEISQFSPPECFFSIYHDIVNT